MDKKIVLPFDMSLRLWSDSVPLDDVGGRLSAPVTHLHVKGRPIIGKPPVAGRLAKRHYASLAHDKGTTLSDVTAWLRRTAQNVEADAGLVHLLETQQVEALFWIAMFGRDPVPTPKLDPDLVSSIARLQSRALIENYTPIDPDLPTKTWYPDRLA